jgi:hypothetical protein
MPPVSHQTIKLSSGKHSTPHEGACVMELASMLAGEPFGDHPASVCPVIGSLLRAYNDSVDDAARQDLYDYAAKVVGSRAGAEIQRLRAERVAAWSSEVLLRRLSRFLPPAAARRICRMRTPPLDSVGTHAIRLIPRHTAQTHAAVLALVDELLAIGWRRPAALALPGGAPSMTAAGRDVGARSLHATV